MNTQKIIDVARQQIPDLTNISGDIYRGTLQIENKVAGVYYFDLSNAVPEDFESYQEQLLSDAFYSSPGSTQWNYYLFLLNDTISPEDRKKIEENDRYARKFVLSEKTFEDFFHIEAAEQSLQSNIITVWKTALDAADLQEVYGQETYTSVFDRFCNNQTKKNKVLPARNVQNTAERISFIDRISLKDNYRRYPSPRRDFGFGKVNLVQGINGAGKTSLFEAIELMLCGVSFRNVTQANPNGCIEAEYNHSRVTETYQLRNPGLYQSRDLEWYANAYNRGNSLYNSFNRFNYFNADAAHDFAKSTTDADLKEALFNIILGPEYTYIQERSAKMLSRLRPEYNRLEGELAIMKEQLATAEKFIKAYVQPENLKSMLLVIQQVTDLIPFVNGSYDYSKQAALVEQENNRLQVVLENFATDNFSFDTLAEHVSQLAVYNTKKQEFSGSVESMKTLNHNLAEQQKLGKKLERNLAIIDGVLSYLQESKFMELRGLDDRIKVVSFQKQKKEFLRNSIADISIETILSELSFDAYIDSLNAELEVENKEKNVLASRINEAIGQLGKLEAVVKEIRHAGQQYLEFAPDASDCPMCNTTFSRADLVSRLSAIDHVGDEVVAGKLESDRKILDGLNDKLAGISQKLKEAEKIRNAYQTYQDTISPASVDKTLERIQTLIGSIADDERELDQLKVTESFGRLSGKSEQEIRNLENSLAEVLGDPLIFTASDLPMLEDKLSALKTEIAGQETFLNSINEQRYALGLEIKKLLDYPADKQIDVKVAEEALNRQGDKLQAFLRHFSALSSVVVVKEGDSITALKSSSDLLKAHIASQREVTQAESELNAAKENQVKGEKFIKETAVRHQRLKRACETLVGLSENDAEGHLAAFFEQNFGEITDIFKSIHMPREFVSLEFENTRITLIDDHGDRRKITEISTGQRSALALSIFLSLNKKLTNGPEVIMFDDPVAYIDDFNALSFIDYLRNYVLRSGKQIFFATANTRLAHLFEKKFAFLGDDGFVNIKLKR